LPGYDGRTIGVETAEQWRLNAEIVEPFSNGTFGYQWLAPETSDIQVLLSKSGDW
jgi:hypothetical protein